jgi:Flp pilus assembly protein TadB
MSLMIEFASFLGGAMSEYAQQKRWGNVKIFTVSYAGFVIIFALYFLLFPPVNGLFFGITCAAFFGLFLAIFSVVLIRYAIRRKQKAEEDHV